MSKKSRERARERGKDPLEASPSRKRGGEEAPARGAKPGRGRILGFRLTAALVLPALILAGLEAGLRLGGFGYPTSFFLRSEDGKSFTSNRKFCRQFYAAAIATEPHPLVMAAKKPPGALRIFVLGESAAEGTPDPAFGFSRILEILLAREYPPTRFEVVNAAVRGINSHIILPIARECAAHEPDLFILYMGNNEVVGLHTPVPGRFNLTPYLTALRFEQRLKSTKTAQLAASLAGRWAAKTRLHDMDFFRRMRMTLDDPQREPVYENFRQNLGAICDVIQSAGAKTILSTVAVNLRDFPPLGSLHRRGLTESDATRWVTAYAKGIAAESGGRFEAAVQSYEEAARVDDHFADLHFRLARSLLATGQTNQAREQFILARDWDAIQFRSDSRINEIIRTTAASRAGEGLRLLDAEKVFAGSPASAAMCPGAELFRDDVHFTFAGDYLLANAALPEVAQALGLGRTTNAVPSQSECAELLAFTPWDECNVLEAMADLTTQPPFLDQIEHQRRRQAAQELFEARRQALGSEALRKCARTYLAAVQWAPGDWMLRLNYGRLWTALGKAGLAARELEKVAALFPREPKFRIMLAEALKNDGHPEEAAREIEAAARVDPGYPPLQPALAWARTIRNGGTRPPR
jgi:tetratricopeptide (TPR) repeat protein